MRACYKQEQVCIVPSHVAHNKTVDCHAVAVIDTSSHRADHYVNILLCYAVQIN